MLSFFKRLFTCTYQSSRVEQLSLDNPNLIFIKIPGMISMAKSQAYINDMQNELKKQYPAHEITLIVDGTY